MKNFITVVHTGQENLEIASTHLVEKGITERKPQLVLRRPGLFVKEVQVLELKVGHHSELPLAGLHIKPKLQVNIQLYVLCVVEDVTVSHSNSDNSNFCQADVTFVCYQTI